MFPQRLKEKKIVIYGTGHVARKFYKALVKHGFQEQIQYFVRTRNVNAGEVFEGISVYCFDDIHIDNDMMICLAVHESLRAEIENTVKQRTNAYIWIYPYLYELMLGEPQYRHVELEIASLLDGYQNDLRLGVRLAAIEQYEQKNSYGFDYYIKAQMLHCDKDTAVQRLGQFQQLIAGWKQSGYQKDSVLVLNRGYGVIDGNHRVAMAMYTQQKTIYGDIYPTDLSVKDIHGYEPMLAKELLLQHDFTADDIQRLELIQQKYIKAYRDG